VENCTGSPREVSITYVPSVKRGMPKLTYQNQGYWDRLQRAESWIQRALDIQDWDDQHGPFIFYWIALNALYGRHHDSQRWDEQDLAWFLQRVCEMDLEQGKIPEIVHAHKRKADRLLNDQFLLKAYWRDGPGATIKQILKNEFFEAQSAFDQGKISGYLQILFRRLRVLRNQIFHGCSTDRRSLNQTSLQPALEILEKLVPQFHDTFRNFGQNYDWPKIPYPRKDSPQHPGN
jgi:hypothetical protein